MTAAGKRTWTYRELARDLRDAGCEPVRQKGSHEWWQCPGGCAGPVPVHPGRNISPGVLRKLRNLLEPCIGRRSWMP